MENKSQQTSPSRRRSRELFEMILLTIFGVMMFATKMVMAVLPNVHLLGMFIMVFTLAFRSKALIPIYIYVLLEGAVYGFGFWWYPYLYVWTVLWGLTILLPKNMPPKVACAVYPVICALHGLAFGILCAPVEALVHNLNFEQTLAWIAMGLPFDVTHAISNFCFGLLVLPLALVLERLKKNSRLA